MRFLCWFSCGEPSAVAAKLCLGEFGKERVTVINCDTKPSEHPDNRRFFNQVQEWLGVPIVEIRSENYITVDEVFEKTRYMSGPKGARCTTELKKIPRLKFAQPDDIHVFGFTYDEKPRAARFTARNPELNLFWPLIVNGMTRSRCRMMLGAAGISPPTMYLMGFDNNNCPGCVKASSPWYWDMVRTHFPGVFKRRCEQSRAIGCRLVEIHHHERIFLDELPAGPFRKRKEKNLSCGPECGMQLELIKADKSQLTKSPESR